MMDSDYRFTSFAENCVGSTHDSIVHAMPALGMLLNSNALPSGYWISGDDAYACTESLIRPYPSTINGSYEEVFNFYQSSLRMHVEQSFGMLKKRWGILWKPLAFSIEANCRIICAAMVVQNYCIDRGVSLFSNTEDEIQKREERIIAAEESLDAWLEEVREGYTNGLVGVTISVTQARMLRICLREALLRPVTTYKDLYRPTHYSS